MTSRPDSFMPVFIADYLADTTHLERDQDGAYFLLLMAYWRRGGPLLADDARLMRIAKATPQEWRKLRPVMAEFFREADGYWHNKRADQEIAKANARFEAKAKAGKQGADARWQNDGAGNGTEMSQAKANQSLTDGSLPSHHVSSETCTPKPPRGLEVSAEFETFWKAYPRTKGMSKIDAFKAWEKLRKLDRLPTLERMLEAVAAYKAKLADDSRKRKGEEIPVKHAQGWLSGERFASFLAEPGSLSMAAIAASLADHQPDWADELPEWLAFKKSLSPRDWSLWFSKCRPNGSPSVLIVPTAFEISKIREKFGDRLTELTESLGGSLELKVAKRIQA